MAVGDNTKPHLDHKRRKYFSEKADDVEFPESETPFSEFLKQ